MFIPLTTTFPKLLLKVKEKSKMRKKIYVKEKRPRGVVRRNWPHFNINLRKTVMEIFLTGPLGIFTPPRLRGGNTPLAHPSPRPPCPVFTEW
jgi:hypothetical protein